MTCESEKISLQTQLLNMQTNVHNDICNKAEKQEGLKAYKEHNTVEKSNAVKECRSKLEDTNTLKLEKNDSCIIIESVSKLYYILYNLLLYLTKIFLIHVKKLLFFLYRIPRILHRA